LPLDKKADIKTPTTISAIEYRKYVNPNVAEKIIKPNAIKLTTFLAFGEEAHRGAAPGP
jgi:hypothetical protein